MRFERCQMWVVMSMGIMSILISSTSRAAMPQEKAADIDKLADMVKNGREAEKIESLRRLERLGKKAEAATKTLIQSAIGDTSPSIREQAGKVLLKVNPKLGKPILILIEHKDAKKVTDAANELAAMKTTAEPAVQALLVSMRAFDNALHQPERPKRDPKVVEACVNAIAAICPNDRDMLGEMGQTAALNNDAPIRLAAVKCLTTIAGCHPSLQDDVKKYLQGMLLDADVPVRKQVYIELNKFELSARERMVIAAAARKDSDAEIKTLAEKIGAKQN